MRVDSTALFMTQTCLMGALVSALSLGTAEAQIYNFVASPSGDENGQCTQTHPCSPQGAVKACPMGAICNIALQPGVYADPAVNMYYHRTIAITGDCNDPHAVVFRATRPNTALVQLQDHVIGGVSCLRLDSVTTGTIGIAGRQHAIGDYASIVFGQMPGGVHIAMNELSIASCLSTASIEGNARVHVLALNLSKVNIGCEVNLAQHSQIEIFISASFWSIVDAASARFAGAGAEGGEGVRCSNNVAIVVKPSNGQPFPGTTGDCQ
jgi:hypothetical protein